MFITFLVLNTILLHLKLKFSRQSDHKKYRNFLDTVCLSDCAPGQIQTTAMLVTFTAGARVEYKLSLRYRKIQTPTQLSTYIAESEGWSVCFPTKLVPMRYVHQ